MPVDRTLCAAPLAWAPGVCATPPPGVIDIWRIEFDRPAELARALAVLTADDKARADNYRFERHRNRFILGRAALREILGAYCGVAGCDLRIEIEDAGRPRIAGGPAFSFSRTPTLAVLAVAESGALGVDIEPVVDKADLSLVVADQYSPDERAQLAGLAQGLALEAFFRGWTAKEALVKATGEGLTSLLPAITVELDPQAGARLIAGPPPYLPAVWRLEAFAAAPGILGAVASDRPIAAVRALVR